MTKKQLQSKIAGQVVEINDWLSKGDKPTITLDAEVMESLTLAQLKEVHIHLHGILESKVTEVKSVWRLGSDAIWHSIKKLGLGTASMKEVKLLTKAFAALSFAVHSVAFPHKAIKKEAASGKQD